MNKKNEIESKARAEILKSLAHPTRIFIVDLIYRNGAHCVQELTELVGVDASTISRHLSVLKSAGIVTDSKAGTKVYYDLACDCIGQFMSGLQGVVAAKRSRDLELMGFPAGTAGTADTAGAAGTAELPSAGQQ